MTLLMHPDPLPVRAAVAFYGNGEFTEVRRDLPVLVVRAGKDWPQMNERIDRMAAQAVAANAPWTVLNVAGGHHAFDVLDDTEESRQAIRATLAFLATQLQPSPTASRQPEAARVGMAHYFAREWPEAEAAYKRYVVEHPDDADALTFLATAQMEQHKQDEAAANVKKALALDPSIADAWALAGRIENDKKNYPAALQNLEKAVALMPEDGNVHHQIGKARLAQREIPAAVTSLQRAVELTPMNGWAWNDLAHAYLAAKEPAKAAATFEKVIPFAPQHPGLLYNTACAYALSGDAAKALDLLDRAVASGFKDKAGMMADPDLASVRSDPRFV
jgi:Flp pilus assembly protein TadD